MAGIDIDNGLSPNIHKRRVFPAETCAASQPADISPA